jgi:TolB protein
MMPLLPFLQNTGPASATILAEPGIIAFYRTNDGDDEIYVMNSDGSDQTNVSNDPASDADPSLSPDGSKIAFTSFRDGNYEIYVMNSDGSDQTNVSNDPASDYYPNWSPDGTKIAFTRYDESESIPNEQVWIMDADGSDQEQLTTSDLNESRPAFSPDGTKIAFSRLVGENWDVHVMESDGTYLENLSEDDLFDSDAAWSPDGSKIAFTSFRDGNYEVYVMNADGSDQTNLSNNDAWDSLPSWSPEGSQIVFHSTREGPFQIYIMNADGTYQTNIGNSDDDDSDPSWALPAPAPSDTAPPNHPPLNELVSWYRAEGNFEDSVGSNDGVEQSINGGVDHVPGKIGQTFDFGGGDWIEINNDPSLNFGTGSFTVGAWINADSQSGNIMVHGASGCVTPIEAGWSLNFGFEGGDIPAGSIGFDVRDENGQFVPERQLAFASAPSAGEWHHIAGVFDKGEGGLTSLYIDGEEVATDSIPEGFGTPDNNGKPAIGANNRGGGGGPTCGPDGFFEGDIDEVTIHSRALFADEIQAMFDAGNAVLINSGDPTTTSPAVDVTLTCTDDGSGCERIDVTFANIEANTDDDVIDTIPIEVSSETDPGGNRFAEETGLNTAIFNLEIVNSSDDIEFGNGEKVTATGTLFDATPGTKSVDVVFTDGDDNFIVQGDSIELIAGVQPTTLTLNALRDVTATTGFTVSGELVIEDTGEGISGQQIDFTGTGVTPSLQSVMTEGVTFTGMIDLMSCETPAEPESDKCTTDDIGTDSSTSDNIVLHLGVGGKIMFPAGTVTAKIYLQDMGTASFKYVVEERNGALQPEATSAGALSPIVPKIEIVSGYTDGDPNGLKELTITEITGGPSVGIAAVLTGNPDGLPVEQHQINFEEFGDGPQTSPFIVNPGFFFSTGFAQNTDEEGLDITAHYAGSGAFAPGDSETQLYNVLANTAGLGGEGSQNPGGATGTSITTLDCNTEVGSVDTDNDGICDIWEQSGITLGGGFYQLVGAAVGQRDIFVEIDCMTGFCPTTSGTGINNNIQTIVNVFAAEGFTLHIDVDETNLSVADPLHVWTDTDGNANNDFNSIKNARFGTAAERSGGTLGSGNDNLRAKAQVYHYGLFAKNINTGTNTACGPSGQAELGGNDFIVSVGCTTGTAGTTFKNSHQERIGTLMHELGHNLGLRHGGGDDDNCKPNMISVMNYARQFPWGSLAATTSGSARTEWSPTYSRQDLQDLNENSLQESQGLTITTSQWNSGGFSSFGTGTSTTFEIIWGRPAVTYGTTGGSVNWNNVGGNTASLNINTLSGMTGCTGTLKSVLKSYDEWAILDLNFRDAATIDGLSFPDPDTLAELTPTVLEGAEDASMVGPNNVFNNPGISVLPDVATDAENNIYVVWSEKPGLFSGNFEILFSKSVDGGATFSPPEIVSNNAGNSLTPRITESDGILYVVWSDKTGGTSGKYDIRFSKSSDMGDNWDPSVKLSSNSGDSLTPSIAASGSDVYVVWSDKTGGTSGKFDIQFKKSVDGGTTFTPNTASGTKVSSNSGESLTPDIDVSASGIFVVWSDTSGGTSKKFDILFKKSTDGGMTFLPNTANAKNISTNSGHSLTPSLAVDGDSVYVTWSDTTGGTSKNFDILFKKSTDGGTSFTPDTASAKNISTTSSLSATPRIAVSSGNIYIAWSDIGTPGQFDIFVKKSGDGGDNFEEAVNISDNTGQSITPAIALTDVLHLVWGDLTPGITGDIMYASRIV